MNYIKNSEEIINSFSNKNNDEFKLNLIYLNRDIDNIKNKVYENYLNEKYPNFNWLKKPYKTKDWAIHYLIEHKNIQKFIKKVVLDLYGRCCSVDKVLFLYNSFFRFHFLCEEVVFEKKFYIPETVESNEWFKLIFEIMLIVINSDESLKNFIKQFNKIKSKHKKIIKSKTYIVNELKDFIGMFLDQNSFYSNVFFSEPTERYPNSNDLIVERNSNLKVIKLLNDELHKDQIDFNFINDCILSINTLNSDEHKINYPLPKMNMGQKSCYEEEHENNIKYHFFCEPFQNYRNKINPVKKKLLKIISKIKK